MGRNAVEEKEVTGYEAGMRPKAKKKLCLCQESNIVTHYHCLEIENAT
jgi:hypothetical protein